jgi:hypothetical protein
VGIVITGPMSKFGPMLFGVTLPIVIPYLASVIVVLSMFAPILLPRASRPLYVDSSYGLMRVGLRTMPIDDLRHAYRLPDGLSDGRFQLKLAVPGIDALVGVSARPPAEMSTSELDALLALIERAPIVPDPALPLRPPLGDELGARSAAEAFDDDLTRVLLDYETTSFAKPTLLSEIQAVRSAVDGTPVDSAAAIIRDIGVVAPGTTKAPRRNAALAAEAAELSKGPRRGFWALQSARYRAELSSVESWLQSASGNRFAPQRGWQWAVGLLIIIAALLSPWLSAAALMLNLGRGGTFVEGVGPIAFFIFTWPFIAWAGFMLMWVGRIARFQRARAAALDLRRAGIDLPDELAQFFGAPFPEVAFADPATWHGLVQFIVLLAGGLTTIGAANGATGQYPGEGVSLVIGTVVGVLMVLGSAVVFTLGVRGLGSAPLRQLRARAIFTALSSDPR